MKKKYSLLELKCRALGLSEEEYSKLLSRSGVKVSAYKRRRRCEPDSPSLAPVRTSFRKHTPGYALSRQKRLQEIKDKSESARKQYNP